MTTTASESSALEPACHDSSRAPLRSSLMAYAPGAVSAEVWKGVRDDAVDLVLAVTPTSADRARKDLELVAQVAGHLVRSGVAVSLDDLLSDATLVSFDSAQRAAGRASGTRANQRARFRRLQAVRAGVPWRKERRADGERVAGLVQPTIVNEVAVLLHPATAGDRSGAEALGASLEAARRRRRDSTEADVPASAWRRARSFAQERGLWLTRRHLAAAATYEVLSTAAPVASLVREFGLTRRDLDLGLALAQELSDHLGAKDCEALRG